MASDNSEFERQIEDYFHQTDVDGTGYVSRIELCKIIQKAGSGQTTEEISRMFDEVDANRDDELSLEELKRALLKQDPKTVTEAKIRALFKTYDIDGTGCLTEDEIKQALQKLNIKGNAEKILNETDKNDDNKVCFEEFLTGWKNSLS